MAVLMPLADRAGVTRRRKPAVRAHGGTVSAIVLFFVPVGVGDCTMARRSMDVFRQVVQLRLRRSLTVIEEHPAGPSIT
jgi:hypothetical protein